MDGVCPFCGSQAPPQPGPEPGLAHCPTCGQERDLPVACPPCPPPPDCDGLASLAEQPEPPAPSGLQGPAWEADMGVLRGLLRTTWQMLSHPGLTLAPPPAKPGLSWPLAYAMILGTLSSAAQAAWGEVLDLPGSDLSFNRWLVVLAPLIALVGVVVGAGIQHAMLFILGAAKNGYRATLRAMAYSQAAGALALLPLVGGLGRVVWVMVMLTAGLSAVHGIGKGRAFAAIILPLLLVILLVVLAVSLVGLSVFLSAWQEMRNSPL